MMPPTFTLLKTATRSRARAGILHTLHGDIPTPVFMPVGTQATVKSLTTDHLRTLNVPIILSNTYHLALRPGTDLIAELGGLHHFMNWDRPILTDSGGFQVFSLAKIRKIKPEGVMFHSHLDGSKHLFTPESVIDHQRNLGSDIMMPLDICTPHPATHAQTAHDLDITLQWAAQAKNHWEPDPRNQLLFGIVQGGIYPDLREKSATALQTIDFPGYAIGGVSVGESKAAVEAQIRHTAPLLPDDKPKYVMGLGEPENLKFAIDEGIDMFDCVLPTRLARHGHAFTATGRLNIKNATHTRDPQGLDPTCSCGVCTTYSRAYLRHLFMAKEMLGPTLLSLHNIHFLIQYVTQIRTQILEGTR